MEGENMKLNRLRKGKALKVVYGSGFQLAVVEEVQLDNQRIVIKRWRKATKDWADPVAIHASFVLGEWDEAWPKGAKESLTA
jgi:hypothetical protein